MTRRFVFPMLGVLVTGAVLWGVWELEAKPRIQEARKDQEFSYELPQKTSSLDVLINCLEELMDGPAEAFAKWRGLQGIPLDLPGGPLVISKLESDSVHDGLKPAQRAAIEFLKRYSPRRIVLVSHDDCIFYDVAGAWENKSSSVHEHQLEDLRASMRVIQKWFPNAEVTGYMASKENNKMVFRPITL